MSRFRLEPTRGQESVLLRHCSDARYVWNLCVEQENEWRPGRGRMPRYVERCRQLTEARADNAWLAEGSVTVQQQAIKDHDRAMKNYFNRTHERPTWRKQGRGEGFRVVAIGPGAVRRLNRNHAEVRVPKVGWVRFRWSRPVTEGVKSYRVTCDRSGRWHIAFASVPDPIPAPGNGEVVGVDRGVVVSAALSTGEMLQCPGLSSRQRARLRSAERKLSRAKRGSARRGRAKAAVTRLRTRDADRRKDWCEQVSTGLARRFDLILVEDLRVRQMIRSAKGTKETPGKHVTQKARLNNAIQSSGWGLLVQRLEEKAPGRVEKVPPRYTSQRCSACGHVDRKSRESQADFRCTVCGYACNADVNAARNIAAGHAVKARGGDAARRPVNREPQPVLLPA